MQQLIWSLFQFVRGSSHATCKGAGNCGDQPFITFEMVDAQLVKTNWSIYIYNIA